MNRSGGRLIYPLALILAVHPCTAPRAAPAPAVVVKNAHRIAFSSGLLYVLYVCLAGLSNPDVGLRTGQNPLKRIYKPSSAFNASQI